jgi:UDP-N-acetyl-D-galactosamine dehydrogenase
MGIDTNDVLDAAGTKWNFLKFKPGLVGGHCIGVDPYYLAQKAEELGYHPEIILAGRRLNDGMGKYVAGEVVKIMVKKDIKVKDSKALILGFTFKEDCPDVRNTKVIDIVRELETYGIEVIIHDPWADENEVLREYGIISTKIIPKGNFQTAILAVAHNDYKTLNFEGLIQPNGVVYDVKGILRKGQIDGKL